MITIDFKHKKYNIDKGKLLVVISKGSGQEDIKDEERFELMERYSMFNHNFLSHMEDL